MKKFLVIPFMLLCASLVAQTGGFSITAVGDVSPVLIDNVTKISDPAVKKDTVLPAPSFDYTLQPKKFMTSVQIDTIKAAKLGNESVPKLYNTYARLGVGNYATITGEFYANSTRSKTSAWGFHARHFSAGKGPGDVQGDFSGFGQQQVDAFGKYFFRHHTLTGGLDYDRHAVYNYGSDVAGNSFTKDFTKQTFNYWGANVDLLSHLPDSSDINHHGNLRYYHLSDRYKVKEDNLLFSANGGTYLRGQMLNVDLGVDYNHVTGAQDTVNSTILHVTPMIRSRGNKFDASIGIAVYGDLGAESFTYFYPQASFSYDIVNHIIVPYVTLGGYLERNSMRTMTDINPFLMTTEAYALKNTQHKYELSGGLKGSISSEIVYDLRATRVELDNMPFFVNTIESQDIFRNKFAAVYDNVDLVQAHAQLGWQHFEKVRLDLSGDYYHYTMTNELHPWHTPTLRLGLLAEYNLQDKLIGRMDVCYLDGMYARMQNGSGYSVVNLKGLVDVNLGFEYRYTKFFSVFLNLNNLANQRYERWYAYPTQRFNFLAGATYTF
ncbi:MAG TPA: hypothetical protein VFU15_09885 [Bacteroidia bacterium]|nr:hypothetical protein [Bacteroidia bacterium]